MGFEIEEGQTKAPSWTYLWYQEVTALYVQFKLVLCVACRLFHTRYDISVCYLCRLQAMDKRVFVFRLLPRVQEVKARYVESLLAIRSVPCIPGSRKQSRHTRLQDAGRRRKRNDLGFTSRKRSAKTQRVEKRSKNEYDGRT
jgi:hypothetical protein